MKQIFSLFLFMMCAFNSNSQEEKLLKFKGVDFAVYSIPVNSTNLSALKIISNPTMLETDEFLREYSGNINQDFFACNAGIETLIGEPLGLFTSSGIEANPINLADGNGNFYLKPNGVFYFTDSDADVINSMHYVSSPDIRYAIQSGPLLLENGSIHNSFNETSQNLNFRIGVGISESSGAKELLFAISRQSINLFSMAIFFRDELKCTNALCLESGRSFIHFPSENAIEENNSKIGHFISFSPSTNAQDTSLSTQGVNKPARVVVPMFKGAGGLYNIPVTVNGVLKISFILDSGASDVSISPDVALTLMRTGTIEKSDYLETTTYSFADGSTAESDVFNIKEINIGGFIIRNVRCSISNNLDAPMLLGQSVMQRIGSYTIDNAVHCLIIN
jgi:clan AA aspartic protease (TIGR02281 family)